MIESEGDVHLKRIFPIVSSRIRDSSFLLGLTYRHGGRGWRYAKTDQHMLMTVRVGIEHSSGSFRSGKRCKPSQNAERFSRSIGGQHRCPAD